VFDMELIFFLYRCETWSHTKGRAQTEDGLGDFNLYFVRV